MDISLTLPDLEERFLPPPNWRIETFNNPVTGHDIYYRTAYIEKAKATVICLPGLSEFGEKYIETARFLNDHGYNFVTIDWAYQGFSTRFKNNPHKRHSDGYNTDISDLHYLLTNQIDTAQPLYMLAHSMGGHIGLRYISEHPNIFKAASFSAPMFNIKALKYLTKFTNCALTSFTRLHNKYVVGGHDWRASDRHVFSKSIFSHDPIRDGIHNAWCLSNPRLQVGSTTYKWICESLRSIQRLKDRNVLKNINIPILLSTAGKEKLVDNKAIEKAAYFIPQAKLLPLNNAKHEILMETDDIRDAFLDETLKLFNQ